MSVREVLSKEVQRIIENENNSSAYENGYDQEDLAIGADDIIQALTSAGYTIERGWCDDMSLADPKQHEYIIVEWSYIYGDDAHPTKGFCVAEHENGGWVDQDREVNPAIFKRWRPITPPNGGE